MKLLLLVVEEGGGIAFNPTEPKVDGLLSNLFIDPFLSCKLRYAELALIEAVFET